MPFPLIDELGDIDTRRQCPDLHFGILCLERALSHGFPVEGEQGEYDFSDRLGKSDVEKIFIVGQQHRRRRHTTRIAALMVQRQRGKFDLRRLLPTGVPEIPVNGDLPRPERHRHRRKRRNQNQRSAMTPSRLLPQLSLPHPSAGAN